MKRSVVVTGANGGIGLATALELAAGGYDVIGTARTREKAARVEQAAAQRGLTVRTVRCDVADAASTQRAFAEIAERTGGGPWAVVNNAGYAQSGAIEDVDDEAVHAQLEVNLVAPLRIARLVLPAMRERGEGRIVNVSSIAGRVSSPLVGWYCASKHGLEAATDALRVEVAPFGVAVILVEPGGFGTGIWAEGQGRLPRRDRSPYAQAYERADRLTGRGASLPDPVWVGRAIRLALGTPVPLARYLVGVDAVAGVLTDSLLPTVVGDYVKGLVAGLRRLPGRNAGREAVSGR
jgi:NAD(P)-dependent dehydrogenase (short-subunit alcohol dehydrogenase family)